MRQGAITITRAFVLEIEEERARLSFGDSTAVVPIALLPDGVAQGEWIELRVKAIPDSATDARRAAGADGSANGRLNGG